MRVGFDAKRYYHNRTGLGNYARTLVAGLRALDGGPECRLYDERPLTRTLRLGRKAAAEGCRVLHGLSNELPLDALRARIPTVVTMHDTAWRCCPDMYTRADRLIYDLKYGWAARHADLVVAISESTRRDVSRLYGLSEARVRVVYQAAQPLFYELAPRAEARREAEAAVPGLPRDYLLSVGSVNSRKNLLGTLAALAALPPGIRPPLVVVGRGREYMMECRRFALERLGRMDVFWADRLADNRALRSLYRCAMALLYPSRYEGFGLPVAEALLQGCPALTSRVSSLPEAAGGGAVLVDPADGEEMAEALRTLVDDSALRERLAATGRAHCLETFDPPRLAARMAALYREVAAG